MGKSLRITLVAVLVVMLGVGERTASAEQVARPPMPHGLVPSTGANDELRCSSVGYNRFSSTTWGQFSRCYAKDDWPASWKGTMRSVTTGSTELGGSVATRTGATTSGNGCTMGGTIVREAYYGPMATSAVGPVPIRGVVYRTNCTNGTYFNNLNSAQHAALTTVRGYVAYPTLTGVAWSVTGSADTVDAARVGGEGGLMWGGLVADLAAATAIAWPPDWYTGGAAGGGSCPGVSISGPSATVPMFAGDTVALDWTITAGMGVSSVAARWVSTGGGWNSVYVGGSIGLTGTYNLAFPSSSSGRTISQVGLEFRCIVSLSGSESISYQVYGTDGFVDDTAPQSACMAASVSWPARQDVAAGGSLEWRVSILGGPGTDGIASIAWALLDPDEVTTVAPSDATYTVANIVRNSIGAPVTPYPAEDLATGFGGYFAVPFATAGNTQRVLLRCENEDGSFVYNLGGWKRPPRGTVGDVSEGPQGCEAVELGWNPTSWVPGAISLVWCAVYEGVIPDQTTLDRLGTQLDGLLAKPPLQWADEGVSFVLASSVEFAPWATHGPACVDLLDSEMCPREWGDGFELPGWAAAMILFGLWSGLVFVIWRFF